MDTLCTTHPSNFYPVVTFQCLREHWSEIYRELKEVIDLLFWRIDR